MPAVGVDAIIGGVGLGVWGDVSEGDENLGPAKRSIKGWIGRIDRWMAPPKPPTQGPPEPGGIARPGAE
ncbi:MAG: hypothetical protein KGJ62_08205 [Armatimonadetes bacterium]|nr:hypothetical protein [Armatimonadota bacterium]MDE2205259.1 hypothetical protein [Armatimonadota bacterium]